MTNANAPQDIFLVSEDDEEYVRMLREEEVFWDAQIDTPLAREPRPAIQRYRNERYTGDPEKLWYQTIGDEGEFTNGCVFGAGPGKVEEYLLGRHPKLRLTIFDLSSDALSRLQQRLDAKYPGRAETKHQDLNFIDLPAETYDLLIANASMHHLVNLEHLAFQVGRSLTPEGRFFMEDVVGESYFQFAEEKKRIFQTFMDATQDSSAQPFKMDWPSRDNWTSMSPFESIRSGDILEVFGRYLLPLRIRTSGALVLLTLFVRTGGPEGRLTRAIHGLRSRLIGRERIIHQGVSKGELLFFLDSVMCDSGRLVPGQAFGIYAKRGGRFDAAAAIPE